jgi:putative acetyltransferase
VSGLGYSLFQRPPFGQDARVLLRREQPGDVGAIRRVHASAFASFTSDGAGTPAEVALVDALRADDGWIPELSVVAVGEEETVVGHVVCTRGAIADHPALGLGPLGVLREQHGQGVGSALMHAVIGAADAMGEAVVVLLGHPDYYPRFGFELAETYGITPPVPEWAPHFQARTLTSYTPSLRGPFEYARPFNEL